jgi:3-deoxy-D-manno-octulosonic-acid transferase
MTLLIDFAYLLAAIAYSPVVLYRMAKHRRYRTGWAQRFGRITRTDNAKKSIWIHAVSVGEVNATRTIVEELKKEFSNHEIVISTTTDTGFARANTLYADSLRVFYFPLDFSLIMQRAFRTINPAVCLLMELEVWPNFVHIAKMNNVPIVIVNGRISDRSFEKYKKIKPITRRIFRKVTLILAQTQQYAERFKQISALPERVLVTGSLKYDTAQIVDKVEGSDKLAAQLNIENQKLWVAGATGNDEEKIILDVFKNLKQDDHFGDLRLAIVPRKPERFDEVADLIEKAGFSLTRYSQIKQKTTQPSTDRQTVILGDTMGDLRKFYSLATIIFVGRSLVPMGGSDMAEAAALGKCTIFGPHAFNFTQTVNALLADDGAIMIKDSPQLLQTMTKCLSKPDFAQKIAQNGRNVIKKNQGATKKTIQHLQKLLTSAL